MMFILGGFGEEFTVPVGQNFEERGMRHDCHDAVSAHLMIPISPMPAARGASQPAVAAASAQQALAPGHAAEAGRPAAGETPQPEPETVRPAADGPQAAAAGSGGASHSGSGSVGALAPSQTPELHLVLSVRPPATGGAPQPAVAASAAAAAEERPREPSVAAASDTEPGIDSLDWSADEPAETDVKELHDKLREMESADDIPEDVQRELGRILFLKKTVCTAGFRRQYVASREETVNAIRKLLKRRKDYMWANDLTDGAPESVEGRYLFSHDHRRQLMGLWKEEFHGLPDQVTQQRRDSFKPEKKAAQAPRRRRSASLGAPTGGPTRRRCKAASTPASRGTCNSKRVRKPWPSSSSSPAASTRTS